MPNILATTLPSLPSLSARRSHPSPPTLMSMGSPVSPPPGMAGTAPFGPYVSPHLSPGLAHPSSGWAGTSSPTTPAAPPPSFLAHRPLVVGLPPPNDDDGSDEDMSDGDGEKEDGDNNDEAGGSGSGRHRRRPSGKMMPLLPPAANLTPEARAVMPFYLGVFWEYVNHLFPIIHLATFDDMRRAQPGVMDMLQCAMAAIATQFLRESDHCVNARELHAYAWTACDAVSALVPCRIAGCLS